MRRLLSTIHQKLVYGLVLMMLFSITACGNVLNQINGTGTPVAQVVSTATPFPTAPAVAKPTYIVQRGKVEELLSFTGRWQPRDQLGLTFEIAGSVRRVSVRRGDAVQAGQLLADFQITELENQLASAKLDLQAAQANLTTGNTTTVGSVEDAQIALANAKLQLEAAKASLPWASVASAKVSVDDAKRALAEAQRAYDDAISRPNLPPSTIEQAYQNLQRARNSLRTAEFQYSSAAQSYNDQVNRLKQLENDVIRAQINLEKAQNGGTDVNAMKSVQSAQLRIDQITADIARSSLYSPIDGEVLEVNIKPGDTVKAFDIVIVVGKPLPREIVATLAIGDAQQLSVGLIGVCSVFSRPETAVQCVVRRVPASARDADQTTRIAASMEDFNLAVGQLIEVKLPLQVRENVLWLPPQAIRTYQNQTFVVVKTPDGVQVIYVEIGLRTDDQVEIKSGLEEGMVVEGP